MPKGNRKPTATMVREREERFARYRAAGVPIGDCIRLALSPDPFNRDVTLRAIPDFATRNRLNPKTTASEIYGGRRAADAVCAALAEELGGSQEFWRSLLSPTRETAAAS